MVAAPCYCCSWRAPLDAAIRHVLPVRPPLCVQLACVAADPKQRPAAAEIVAVLSRTPASRRPSLPASPSRPLMMPRTPGQPPQSPPTPRLGGSAQGSSRMPADPTVTRRAASLPEPAPQQQAQGGSGGAQSLAEAGGVESLPSLPSWLGSDVLSPAASLPSPMRGVASPAGLRPPEPLDLPPAAIVAPVGARVTDVAAAGEQPVAGEERPAGRLASPTEGDND